MAIKRIHEVVAGDIVIYCDYRAQRETTVLKVTPKYIFVDVPGSSRDEKFDRMTGMKPGTTNRFLMTFDEQHIRKQVTESRNYLRDMGITVSLRGTSTEAEHDFIRELYLFTQDFFDKRRKA